MSDTCAGRVFHPRSTAGTFGFLLFCESHIARLPRFRNVSLVSLGRAVTPSENGLSAKIEGDCKFFFGDNGYFEYGIVEVLVTGGPLT